MSAETLKRYEGDVAEQLDHDAELAQALRAQISKSVLNPLKEKAAALRAKKRKPSYIRALTEVPGKVPATFFFFRGDTNEPRQTLEPGELTVLARFEAEEDQASSTTIPTNDPARPSTGRRLAFARHLTSRAHSMTARVIVNRIWMHHFGHGIVDTPDDFGALGQLPTHPQLLDWLASEFMDSGWDMKNLHRLIMTSSAYRQSSKHRPELDSIDPENRLYGRMTVRRLEAEVLRDSVLAVSGRLDRTMYGEAVPVMKDPAGQIVVGVPNVDTDGVVRKVIEMDESQYRRSVYILVRRSEPLAVLEMFDAPQMAPNCGRRSTSTVTPQALLLMNSQFTARFAGDFADRVIAEIGAESGDDCRRRVTRAWQLATGTVPNLEEADEALAYLREQTIHFQQHPVAGSERSAEHQALSSFCQALMCSNAFLYID